MKHIPNDKSISCVSEGLGEAKLLKNLITQQILMKYNTGILMKYNPGCDGVTIAKEKMQPRTVTVLESVILETAQ